MPAPVAIVGAIAAFIGVVFKEQIEEQIGKVAAQGVLDKMNIPLDLSGPVNHETITAAICAGPLGGEVTFTNFFDREAVKSDLKRIALERAGAAFGYEGGLGIDSVRERIVSEILEEIRGEIESGAGVYLAAAKDMQSAQQVLLLPKDRTGWNDPVDFTPEGIANREYQAKYRANHTKEWTPR